MVRRGRGAVPWVTVDVSPLPAPEAVDDTSDVAGGAGRHKSRFTRRRPRHGVTTAARPRHFPCFDGLRALAALLVVAVHTSFASGFSGRSWAGIYTSRLEVGVAVFFLISGFLLYRPFAASHIAGGAAPAVGRFWVRRFLRIVPAYWLAFLVTDYVMHIDTKVHPGWHSLLIYLGLVQLYFPSHALTGLTQAWSLCTEVSFYLFVPLYAVVVARGRRTDRQQVTRELLGVAGLFVIGLSVRFGVLHLHSHLGYVMLEWLPSCLDLFALGMFLAVLSSWFAHTKSTPRWLWHPAMPWVSWTLAVGTLWAVSHLGVSRAPLEHNPPGRGLALEALYGLFAFFVLLPAVFGPQQRGAIRWALRCRPVAALGVVSYGIYLWHQAWVDMYIRWTGDLFRIPFPTLFGVALGLSVLCATASYVLVERPVLRLKERLGWWGDSPRATPEAGAPSPVATAGATTLRPSG
jgi:peptidoglycan/LPS O-acetylase OafA/YrhL